MSGQVIAFPKSGESFHGISESALDRAAERMSAQVIEFPPELRELPLKTLGAEWLYFLARARYYRAQDAGEPLPSLPSREWANEIGERLMVKLGPRVAKRYAREIAEAANYLREREDSRHSGQSWRDEWMLTWIAISFDSHGREPSPTLRLIQRAAMARRSRAGLWSCICPRNSPGAA